MKVAEVMTTRLETVAPEATWKHVAERMVEAGVSGLPVVDADGYMLGIVTEADLVSKAAFGERGRRSLLALIELFTGDARWAAKAPALTAAGMMTTAVITTSPEEHVRVAAQRMLERGVKRLPVLDSGRLVGIVSRRDLLRAFHRTDAEVVAEIASRLASARYAPDDHTVTATVQDGVATLEGLVEFESDLAVVEGLARDVPGVVHVVNLVNARRSDDQRSNR